MIASNQRRLSFVLSFVFALCFASFATAQEVESQTDFERTLKDRLSEKINLVIDKELYRIDVSASVKNTTKKILLSGESQSQQNGSENTVVENALPGFQYLEKEKDTANKKVRKAVASKYRYERQTLLNNLNVNLLLDNSVPEEKKLFVEESLKQDLNNSFGDKANLSVKSFDLLEKDVPLSQTIGQWFKSYIDERGGSGLDALFLFLLGLAILGALVWFITKLRKSQKAAAAAKAAAEAGTTKPVDDEAKQKPEIIIEAILNRLVEQVSKNPLQVSCFLKQLQLDNKKALLSATKTPALTVYFQQLMSYFGEAGDTNASSNGTNNNVNLVDLKDRLVAIEQDLERFLKIQTKQVKQQFGYLPLLDENHILDFIETTDNKLRTLTILAKFLAKPQFLKLTENLTVDDKVEVFKLMQTAHFSETELNTIDTALRAKYEMLKDHNAVLVTDMHELEKEFLENDSHVMEVIEALMAQNFPLGPSYEKYKVTFENLLGFESALLRRIIQKVSNETLAKAFARADINKPIKECLGEMRSKLIDSMRTRYTYLDKSEVEKAQTEVLKVYWSMV